MLDIADDVTGSRILDLVVEAASYLSISFRNPECGSARSIGAACVRAYSSGSARMELATSPTRVARRRSPRPPAFPVR
jgi:hypothetical protein